MRILTFILGALLCFGCSGKKTESSKEPAKAPAKAEKTTKKAAPTPKAAPKAPAADAIKDDGKVVTVKLTGNDMMKYNLTEIKVASGRTIKLTLTHEGKMAKGAMGHNFVLLKAGTDVAAFGNKAMMAKDTDYIPADLKGSVIAHTKTLGGGESDSIEFAAPAPGTYDYICSFPGHSSLMKGKLIVQ